MKIKTIMILLLLLVTPCWANTSNKSTSVNLDMFNKPQKRKPGSDRLSCYTSTSAKKIIEKVEKVEKVEIQIENSNKKNDFWLFINVIQRKSQFSGEFNCFYQENRFACIGDDDSGRFTLNHISKNEVELNIEHITFGEPDSFTYSLKFLDPKNKKLKLKSCSETKDN